MSDSKTFYKIYLQVIYNQNDTMCYEDHEEAVTNAKRVAELNYSTGRKVFIMKAISEIVVDPVVHSLETESE